jgi:ATP-dependent Clp protease ATP-binding subunit ClpA
MFERFDEKAIAVVMVAQEEARRLGHNYVGTEHILLGLIGEDTGVAAKVLKSLGVNLKDARTEVEKLTGRGSDSIGIEIPFTLRAQRLLELTLEEARQLGHNYMGTGHLLLGLIRVEEGVAARVLESLGVNLSTVRPEVMRLLEKTVEPTETPVADSPPKAGFAFEKCTREAIRVIMLAQEETRRLGHNYVGTEHILLGLVGEGTGIAAKALKMRNINLNTARIEVEKLIGRGSGLVAVEIPFTPRVQRLLELAAEEAHQLGHNYIGTEHLLLGLIRVEEGVAGRVLENLGVDLAKVRPQVMQLLGKTVEPTEAPVGDNLPTKESTFERFTKTVKVIMLAQEESRRLSHNFVGTEQILLGLIGEETGIAANVLASMKVNLENARTEVEKIIGYGSGSAAQDIPFTPRAQLVIELSVEEARQLGHSCVGTEHLLLGLIREGEGVAARVLENLGINLSKVRTQVIRTLGQMG